MSRMGHWEQITRGWAVAGLCGLAVVLLMTGCQRNVSGFYLSSDKNTVVWLQIVRTPDNRLSGQLAASVLKRDGSIEQKY